MTRIAICTALALVVGLLSSVAPPAAAQPPAPDGPVIVVRQAALLRSPASQVLGNPTGDVTIIEFFDYACPFCKAVEPRLQAFLKADRKARLVVEEFPILTPQSAIASRAALAAARQGKYAEFHRALMLNRGDLDEAAIFQVAQAVGLDVARLRRDMGSPALAAAIASNLKLARAIGVQGTPTFIIDGRIVAQPSASIDFPSLAAASRRSHRHG